MEIISRTPRTLALVLSAAAILATTSQAQSEFVDPGYHAIGGSAGGFLSHKTYGAPSESLVGLSVGISANASVDLGIAYARNTDTKLEALAFSVSKHFHVSQDEPRRFAIFGTLDVKGGAYGAGGKFYARGRMSTNLTLIPKFEAGLYSVETSPNYLSKGPLAGGSIGLSFAIGRQDKFLFVITPELYKVGRTPTVYGVSFGIFSIFDNDIGG